MATEIEYAALASRVYDRSDENRTPLPFGWNELRWLLDVETMGTGFSAGVYQKGNEVVISFTRTNECQVLDTYRKLPRQCPKGWGKSDALH